MKSEDVKLNVLYKLRKIEESYMIFRKKDKLHKRMELEILNKNKINKINVDYTNCEDLEIDEVIDEKIKTKISLIGLA